jgi:hypothetical protein
VGSIIDIHHKKIVGSGVKRFLLVLVLGIWDLEACRIGGRAGCVSCAVRGRGDNGEVFVGLWLKFY